MAKLEEQNIQSEDMQKFKIMTDTTARLTKPWQKAVIITNICWALVLALFMLLAYLSPMKMEQEADYEGKTFSQSAKGVS